MNKIALTYTIDDSGNRQRTIEPQILVDGLPFHADYTVDIFEAAASCRKEGEFFIFTCGCGVPGCAGIYQGVQVRHSDDFIYWKLPNPLDQNRQSESVERNVEDEFVFSKKQYAEAVSEGLEEIKESLRKDKNLDIDPAIAYRGTVLNLNI